MLWYCSLNTAIQFAHQCVSRLVTFDKKKKKHFEAQAYTADGVVQFGESGYFLQRNIQQMTNKCPLDI